MTTNEEIELDDFHESRYQIFKTRDAHKVPTIIGIIFIAFLFGLFGAVYLTDGILPRALSITDEISNPDAFIAERAQQDLKFLTDLGPRIVGNRENEEWTVRFLKQKLDYIQKQAHPNQKMEIDVSVTTGFYEHRNSISIYANLQNIVVKLYSKTNSTHSLLINTHFDSAPTSPGGSDAGINCAIMLEVLRKLSHSSETFQHNIIFLFNGAEETGLQGSRAFISHHKWTKEVKAVINLEAAGAGGKIMLFQVGPGQAWLLNYYHKVPYPNTQVLAEEIYVSGMVYGGTDFTIFKKAGIIGLDFAFIRDSYRYHTKYDGFTNIPNGSFQHVGANILSLVQNLANAPELTNFQDQPNTKAIFYDFLGLFMIYYTETVAIIMHTITSIVSFIIAIKCSYDFKSGSICKFLLYVLMTFGTILLGWVTATLFIIAIVFSINAASFSMSWYGSQWLILGIYVTPAFTCSCIFIALLNHFKLKKYKNKLTISAQTQIQAHVLRLIWTIILIIGTILGIRSSYLVFIPILFHTVAAAVTHIFCLQHSIRKWQIIYILSTIIPIIFLMQQALTFVTFIVPVFGRSGDFTNPELQIGLISLLLTLLITSVFTPLITLVRKPFILLSVLTGLFIIFLIMVFTPLGFPYSANANSPSPQRYGLIYEIHKIHYKINNTGVITSKFFPWVEDGDPRNTFKKHISKIKPRKELNLTDDSTSEDSQMYMDQDLSLKLISETKTKNSVRFNFTASGPPDMDIVIIIGNNTILSEMNLQSPIHVIKTNINSSYFVSYLWGKSGIPLKFSLNFETFINSARPTFRVMLTGSYNHININDNQSSQMEYYMQFLKYLPEWANLDSKTEIIESFIF